MSSLSFEDLKLIAQMFVGQLLKADFTAATSRFDDQMKTVFSEDKLKESWQNMITETRTLLQLTPTHTAEVEDYKVVVIKCQFQRLISM